MKYALTLAEDKRILSATYEEFATDDTVIVDELPEGNIADYRYVDGEYIHDPLPIEPVMEAPTWQDKMDAQVTYTAMMTDTLLPEV